MTLKCSASIINKAIKTSQLWRDINIHQNKLVRATCEMTSSELITRLLKFDVSIWATFVMNDKSYWRFLQCGRNIHSLIIRFAAASRGNSNTFVYLPGISFPKDSRIAFKFRLVAACTNMSPFLVVLFRGITRKESWRESCIYLDSKVVFIR